MLLLTSFSTGRKPGRPRKAVKSKEIISDSDQYVASSFHLKLLMLMVPRYESEEPAPKPVRTTRSKAAKVVVSDE